MSSFTLSFESFEDLLVLLKEVLTQMDASPSKDFITAKKIMKSASILSRKKEKGNEIVKDFIKNYKIWQDVSFWQECFNGVF